MLNIFGVVVRQNVRMLMRQNTAWLHPLIFVLIIVSLFGLSSFDGQLLKSMSAQVVWIAFLLTSLLTIEGCIRKEVEEGHLEQIYFSAYPLWWLVLAKGTALWIVTLPAIACIPLLSMLLHLSFSESLTLCASVLLGSPALTFMSLLGTSITLSLPSGGILLGILLLPLYVPLLIFGTSVLNSTQTSVEFAFLAALSVLTVILLPHAISFAFTSALDD